MASRKIADRVMETELLIIGGGIAGCFAAIKAAEAGVKVTLFEQSSIKRSGAAGGGLDHFGNTLPPGVSPEELALTYNNGKKSRIQKGLINERMALIGVKECWDRIHDLESWGFQVRWDDGNYKWGFDSDTGLPSELHIHGADIKLKLAAKIRQLPVTVLEHTIGIDLLKKNGAVQGSTGFNIRNGQFIVCKAKATLIATGRMQRLGNPFRGVPAGRFKMLFHYPGSGGGLAIAFRSGAELINMEVSSSGGKGHSSGCKEYEKDTGNHAGAFHAFEVPAVNVNGEKIGKASLRLDVFLREENAGRGPCFYDPTHLTEEAYQLMEQNARDEFPTLLELARQRGFNPRTDRYEIVRYKPDSISRYFSGILINEEAKTSVRGLYAAGETTGGTTYGGAMNAAVFGARAGKYAARYIKKATRKIETDKEQVNRHREMLFAPFKQKEGVTPLELELKVRDILDRYCGSHRSEGRLKQGLWRLNSVKERFMPEVKAMDYHEIMSAQEVRNIVLLAEIHMKCALERKESGPGNWRLDYPGKKDAAWKSSVVAKREGEGIKISRKIMPSLKVKASKKK